MVEAAIRPHRAVERPLPRMTEWRMAKIVGKRDRFGQILVEPKLPRDRARNLGYFERVCQPRPIVVALVRQEDLRFVGQPPEGGCVQNAITVSLKWAPRLAL